MSNDLLALAGVFLLTALIYGWARSLRREQARHVPVQRDAAIRVAESAHRRRWEHPN